jgi:hypothetical protein
MPPRTIDIVPVTVIAATTGYKFNTSDVRER